MLSKWPEGFKEYPSRKYMYKYAISSSGIVLKKDKGGRIRKIRSHNRDGVTYYNLRLDSGNEMREYERVSYEKMLFGAGLLNV